MNRFALKYFSKIFKKADSYIIPTLNGDLNPNVQNNLKIFNSTNFIEYNNDLLIPSSINDNHILNSITVKDIVNMDKMIPLIKEISAKKLTHLRVLSEDYSFISQILEQEKSFPNLIVTVENHKLSEEEINDILESINYPLYIGICLSNCINFKSDKEETALRRYIKEMFKYSSQIKVIEIHFDDLKSLMGRTNEQIKVKPKNINFSTLTNFMALSEFRGFLEINVESSSFNEGIEQTLTLFEENLKKEGYVLMEVDDMEIEKIVKGLPIDSEQIVTTFV